MTETDTPAAETPAPLAGDELRLIDGYRRAANYLSVAQIYLLDNPLLREPLRSEHVKPRLLGHFGTVPGLNLVYVPRAPAGRPPPGWRAADVRRPVAWKQRPALVAGRCPFSPTPPSLRLELQRDPERVVVDGLDPHLPARLAEVPRPSGDSEEEVERLSRDRNGPVERNLAPASEADRASADVLAEVGSADDMQLARALSVFLVSKGIMEAVRIPRAEVFLEDVDQEEIFAPTLEKDNSFASAPAYRFVADRTLRVRLALCGRSAPSHTVSEAPADGVPF